MLRLRRVVFGIDSKRELYKEQLDVPAGYFEEFQIRIQERLPHRVKAYQFKEASDAIRQQFGENKRLRFLKQSFQKIKKVLVDTDFVHLHNHTHLLYNRQ
jgi:DNA polymerase-3 subunit alpha